MVAAVTSQTMARVAPLLLFVLSSLASACFDPDPHGDADACAPQDDLCEVHGDCCAFDGSTQSGAGLCVRFGEHPECTGVCYDDGDCGQGCCGALSDTTDYGACGPCSADPFEPAAPEVNAQTCLDGVAFFCECGDSLDVPCGENRESFEGSCHSGSSPADVFTCWAGQTEQGCSAALDACPASTVEEPPTR